MFGRGFESLRLHSLTPNPLSKWRGGFFLPQNHSPLSPGEGPGVRLPQACTSEKSPYLHKNQKACSLKADGLSVFYRRSVLRTRVEGSNFFLSGKVSGLCERKIPPAPQPHPQPPPCPPTGWSKWRGGFFFPKNHSPLSPGEGPGVRLLRPVQAKNPSGSTKAVL